VRNGVLPSQGYPPPAGGAYPPGSGGGYPPPAGGAFPPPAGYPGGPPPATGFSVPPGFNQRKKKFVLYNVCFINHTSLIILHLQTCQIFDVVTYFIMWYHDSDHYTGSLILIPCLVVDALMLKINVKLYQLNSAI